MKQRKLRRLNVSVPARSIQRLPDRDRRTGSIAATFVTPTLKRPAPEGVEAAALETLDAELAALPADADCDGLRWVTVTVVKCTPSVRHKNQ